MDAAEIGAYRQKLGEVELALSADPDNAELRQLRSEIEDLLALSAQLVQAEPAPARPARDSAPASSAREQRQWQIGEACEARYTDGRYYPARVVAVRPGGAYQVAFVGYGDMQDTRAAEMRPAGRTADGRVAKPDRPDKPSKPGKPGKPGKPDKPTKPAQPGAASSQQAWLKFAHGGAKKGRLKAKAINTRSIFKSPETATGRVGVSNSGRGMTQNPAPPRPPPPAA
ncbi:hypothetical protein H4R18_001879 [Coemansia javaensis]|uniref:Tudor domain-containing protein n=1 Tax=Coemansia javaensis TaxID=2761396 RepID=A0A9W8HEF6_9FUNG|nr:hypothetical protein H4R18_001879 [Coemansia javaensis]